VKIEVAPITGPEPDEAYPSCYRTFRFTTAFGEVFGLTCGAESVEQLQLQEVEKLPRLPKPDRSGIWIRPEVWKPKK
jgi:hypothetical protein